MPAILETFRVIIAHALALSLTHTPIHTLSHKHSHTLTHAPYSIFFPFISLRYYDPVQCKKIDWFLLTVNLVGHYVVSRESILQTKDASLLLRPISKHY